MAQVTTGSITGTIKGMDGKVLNGVTVNALNQPTGSAYTTASQANGQFTLPNLKVGGPYLVTIKYTGLKDQVFPDIYVTLGTPVVINASLESETNTLGDVVVATRSGKGIISSQRSGTATYISPKLMQGAPSINRSIQDFARLTPQVKVGNNNATGNASGISVGGQNNRYNQFTIDGANASDGYGLGSTGTSGGQANVNPISIETIQEMQIVLSPYDVTQGGFTGGGINAVTKSGTNTFHGSVYGQYQNEGWIGKSAKYDASVSRNAYGPYKNKTFGASLGGPIIKNKLFFFANVERYEKKVPLAFDPTIAGSGSRLNVDTLAKLRQFMIDTWKYDPGTYGAITNENKSTSVFARIDWNLSNKHKLTFRHNYVDGSNDILSRSNGTSAVFSNGGYKFLTKTNSSVIELNSNFSSRSSNVLRVTYNRVRDQRASKFFPALSITNYDKAQAQNISYNVGSDFSSQANTLDQDVYTLTDNFTLYRGKHTLTFGTSNELFKSKNVFLQGYYGSYTYNAGSSSSNNLANFYANTGMTAYTVGVSTAGKGDKAPADLNAMQFSVYGQDIWSPTDNFKLTYGLRVDVPVITTKAPENAAFNTAFAAFDVRTQDLPKSTPLFSPRAGFNWDINGNAKTQLRGGAGLFTGKVPFVWISNQISGTGITSKSYQVSGAANINTAGIKYNFNPNDPQAGAFIPASIADQRATIAVTDKKFKYPQVFRANLAVDHKLNFFGLVGTLEAMYTKNINGVKLRNLNISENGEGTVTIGNTTRPLWTKFQNAGFNEVIKLENTSEGYSYNLTAQIQKPVSNGWSGSLAYTFGRATSLVDQSNSVALSNWRAAQVVNGLNKLETGISNYDMGSRIVGYVSKEIKYAKRFATSFTLIYTGQSGQRLSYVYSGNVLGDDVNNGFTSVTSALAYIPATKAQANFVDINGGATASQQWENFNTLMTNNGYLYKNRGQNSERNGDRLPFEHHFDLRIAQDIYLVKNHKLQVFLDIINVGNLINIDWGRSYWSFSNDGFFPASKLLFTVVNSGAQKQDGVAVTPTAAKPAFQFNLNSFNKINGVNRPYDVADFTSRWNSQIGLRYSF
jgi:hypothetical protein